VLETENGILEISKISGFFLWVMILARRVPHTVC